MASTYSWRAGAWAALLAAALTVAPRPGAAADPEPQPPPVPVTAAPAKVQDVAVYLDGLGTVQAFNSVQIQAQVTGVLVALPAPEGSEVHKGDVVAEIDPRPYQAALDHATAQRAEDAATLQSAQLDLKRYQNLAQRSFAPVQQVDDQQATVSKNVALLAADDAAIETARINLGFCTIKAPFDGRVSLHQIDVGNLVQAGGTAGIISITQDKPIAVVFTLPEAELGQVRAALARGEVPVLVNADDGHLLARGTLLTPNNTINATSGTIALKAQFDNADDHLWPGQFVNARVQVDTLHNAVTVPTPAIQHGPGGLFLYTVGANDAVATVDVAAGYADGGQTVVTRGLHGGESVVVAGQSRLSPGVRVNTASPDTSGTALPGAQQDSASR